MLLQVYCEGRVLAQSEFTYYANNQFNSDQLFHYLLQNMPQYFNIDDISGKATSLCKLTLLTLTQDREPREAKVYCRWGGVPLNSSRFSRNVFRIMLLVMFPMCMCSSVHRCFHCYNAL